MTPKLLDERYAVYWVDSACANQVTFGMKVRDLLIARSESEAISYARLSPTLSNPKGGPRTYTAGRITPFASREFARGALYEAKETLRDHAYDRGTCHAIFDRRRDECRLTDARRAARRAEEKP